MPEPLTLPAYYLTHDTPDGPRYAYPVPPIPQKATYTGTNITGWAPDDSAALVRRITKDRPNWQSDTFEWVVTDRPIARLVIRWESSGGLSQDWRKKAKLGTTDDVIVRTWEQAPDTPTPPELVHLNADHDEEDCMSCAVIGRVYERVPLPRVQNEETRDMSEWRPLPGDPDPEPNRPWTLSDQSAVAVYGRHTAHLWPGSLTGFRQAVVDALHAHPLVTAIAPRRGGFDHTVYSSSRERKVSVNIPISWDVPQPRARTKNDRGRGPFLAVQAATHRVELEVPDLVTGTSKAAALARWDGLVADWVAKFLPDVETLRACSSCAGRGFHHTPAGAS